jgi:hypothetical protein
MLTRRLQCIKVEGIKPYKPARLHRVCLKYSDYRLVLLLYEAAKTGGQGDMVELRQLALRAAAADGQLEDGA